jgi:hypothetical protein
MDELIGTEMNQGTMDDYHLAASVSTIPIKIIDIVAEDANAPEFLPG